MSAKTEIWKHFLTMLGGSLGSLQASVMNWRIFMSVKTIPWNGPRIFAFLVAGVNSRLEARKEVQGYPAGYLSLPGGLGGGLPINFSGRTFFEVLQAGFHCCGLQKSAIFT